MKLVLKEGIMYKEDGEKLCEQGSLRFNSIVLDNSVNGEVLLSLNENKNGYLSCYSLYSYNMKKDKFTKYYNGYYRIEKVAGDDDMYFLSNAKHGTYGQFEGGEYMFYNCKKRKFSEQRKLRFSPVGRTIGSGTAKLISKKPYLIAINGSTDVGAFSSYKETVDILEINKVNMDICSILQYSMLGSYPCNIIKKNDTLLFIGIDKITVFNAENKICEFIINTKEQKEQMKRDTISKISLSKDMNKIKLDCLSNGNRRIITVNKTNDRGVVVKAVEETIV